MFGQTMASAGTEAFQRALRKAAQDPTLLQGVQTALPRSTRLMTLADARKILNITASKPNLEMVQKNAEKLFKANGPDGAGSPYLQGKVMAAKDVLEQAIKDKKV
eukprot:TRINITY_DN7483_c0_g1_i1.p1 TRINITY_DN7483_c0_g1~~TRINITY_DN7483_c0_g1_i1.p1  ORF type:complete len:120 (-),score=23.39 TRINITY_DN7483_c0_g1_i1:138-452(-)